ncbi:class I adenylate-forming enzyme family protein [Gordonia sp. CPCC 205515]|uniref:class I adenylate-forming enzyme family protein n=1 Tax=Gordonia sp. CPCC 205515 TaxID=3140791 RepID=UPI003AF347E1
MTASTPATDTSTATIPHCHPADRATDFASTGAWHPETFLELFDAAVSARGDAAAVTDPANLAAITGVPPRSVSWTQLDDVVDQVSATLYTNGIRAGDVVAVWLPNTVDLIATYLAIWRQGATATPMPMSYGSHEVTGVLRATRAHALMTVTRFGETSPAATALAIADPITVLTFGPDTPDGAIDASTSTSTADAREYVAGLEHSLNDRITICWTSGTEAAPKGVPRCHGDWLAVGHGVQDGISVGPDSVVLNPFPLVNMAGFAGSLMPWLIGRAHLVQHQPLDLPVFLSQIQQHAVTHTIMPPAVLTLLLQREELRQTVDLSSLKCVGSGGAPLPPGVVAAWQNDLGVEVTNFFGSNEGVCLMGTFADTPDPFIRAQHLPNYAYRDRDWTARLAAHTRVRLVDVVTGGEVTEIGGVGELHIAGPTVFAGYLEGTATTDPFDEQGALRTGDVFELCGESGEYFRFVDRTKEIIIRGGMNIAPAEVEGLLIDHPAIADVAVVGYDDPVMGEKCCAVVVPAGETPPTLDDLAIFLHERGVADFKIPERLEIVEAIPRNPVGKILRRQLRSTLD